MKLHDATPDDLPEITNQQVRAARMAGQPIDPQFLMWDSSGLRFMVIPGLRTLAERAGGMPSAEALHDHLMNILALGALLPASTIAFLAPCFIGGIEEVDAMRSVEEYGWSPNGATWVRCDSSGPNSLRWAMYRIATADDGTTALDLVDEEDGNLDSPLAPEIVATLNFPEWDWADEPARPSVGEYVEMLRADGITVVRFDAA